MRDPRTGSIFAPRVLIGLALIIMGVLFTLDNFGFDDIWDLFWFYGWPALLMVVGLSKVLWSGGRGGRGTGLLIFAVGLLLLLGDDRLGVLRFEFWDLLPVVFVIIGLSVLWRGLFGRREADVAAEDAQVINSVAVMGGSRRTTATADFLGGDLVAVMGGVEIDLSRASIGAQAAVIDAFAMWGGVEIKVPKDWQVTSQGLPLLGAFEDNTEPPVDPRGRLIIKGFAIMGGVEVKNG